MTFGYGSITFEPGTVSVDIATAFPGDLTLPAPLATENPGRYCAHCRYRDSEGCHVAAWMEIAPSRRRSPRRCISTPGFSSRGSAIMTCARAATCSCAAIRRSMSARRCGVSRRTASPSRSGAAAEDADGIVATADVPRRCRERPLHPAQGASLSLSGCGGRRHQYAEPLWRDRSQRQVARQLPSGRGHCAASR